MPYTKQNLNLAFRPHVFFNDLQKVSDVKRPTIESAYYRAIKSGLIEIDEFGHPRLTDKGRRSIQPYVPKQLSKGAHLLVIFDIPEDLRTARNHLRTLLHELSFEKVQQSVWASRFDHREYIKTEIKEYGLEKYVIVYESVRLKI